MFERFARIASNLRFATFSPPKRDSQKRGSVREPWSDSRESGNSRESANRCARIGRIKKSRLILSVFPKIHQKGLDVCCCLWGCHPDRRLGSILGPSMSHPGSEGVPSRFAMCFVLQHFGPIQIPRFEEERRCNTRGGKTSESLSEENCPLEALRGYFFSRNSHKKTSERSS